MQLAEKLDWKELTWSFKENNFKAYISETEPHGRKR
jgi:hypothetical protein